MIHSPDSLLIDDRIGIGYRTVATFKMLPIHQCSGYAVLFQLYKTSGESIRLSYVKLTNLVNGNSIGVDISKSIVINGAYNIVVPIKKLFSFYRNERDSIDGGFAIDIKYDMSDFFKSALLIGMNPNNASNIDANNLVFKFDNNIWDNAEVL